LPKHLSIPIDERVELYNVAPMAENPLLSHCEIKVCYIGQNRNGSVISKEVATKMAVTLHGCPIVGYFDKETKDFSGHNRSIEVGDGKFRIVDKTKAYGFVDSAARVWFQKFTDDGVEHEYLMTEGYLWTSIYEEAKRVVEHGNNQSMELNEEKLDGTWTFDDKGAPKFFIINEAMIQKLCILGEDVEPCFEGAGIAAQFSFDGDFKNQLFSLMEDIKSALSKGGFTSMDDDKKVVDPALEDSNAEFKKKDEDDKKENPFPPKDDDKKEDSGEGKDGEKKSDESDEDKKDPEENDEDKKKKAPGKHSLTDDEVVDSELYKNLAVQFAQLQKEFETLKAEVEPLRQFKVDADRKAKQTMIDSFYMLSDADKKDCLDNIDTYSLNDIEAKLSIICVRNKVSFSLEDDKKEAPAAPKDPLTYSLDGNDDGDSAPAWIKAVRETAKEMN
jgi:hypothetical protein